MEKNNEHLPVVVEEFDPDKAIVRINKSIDFAEKLRGILKPGEDYNKHPGYQKPSLEQPGAEKIAFALNCGPQIMRGEEGKVIDEKYGLKEFNLVVGLVNRDTGFSYGEGVGYDRANEKDLYITDKETGEKKLEPERVGWANNKALKMAFKSGLICAAKSIGSLSGYFTQDLEGIVQSKGKKQSEPNPQEQESKPKSSWDMFWKSIANKGYNEQDRESMNEFIAQRCKDLKKSKTDIMLMAVENLQNFIEEWKMWAGKQ